MTDTKTKNAMMEDIKLAKAKALRARAGIETDKTLKQLVARYGANTYDIVLNAMLKPSRMMTAAGQKYANSKKVIEYYAAHQVPADQLASAIGKSKTEVAKKSSQKVTSSNSNKKVVAKAEVKRDKFNKRVSNRAPSKTASWGLNRQSTQEAPAVVPFKPNTSYLETPWTKEKRETKTKSSPAAKKTAVSAKTKAKPAENSFDAFTKPLWKQVEENNSRAWQKPIMPVASAEEKAKKAYDKAFGARISGEVSLDELMKQTGVTQADIQAVFKQNPEIVREMGGGKTNQALARAASRVSGSCQGGCLGGVQTIYANVSKEKADIVSAQDGAWPKKIPQAGNYNSACNVYIPLEKSGQYITLTYPNKAYHKQETSKEAEAMKEFNKSLPAGTTVCLDNDIPDGYRGKAGLNESEIHGHTWVLDNTKASCSDGRQEDGPKFSRYGKNMHISIAKDNYISKDLALKLIKQKQAREAALAQAKQQNKGRA